VAADVDGDGIPETVFPSFRNATASDPLFPLGGGAAVASGTTYYYEHKVMASAAMARCCGRGGFQRRQGSASSVSRCR
jgi:hypothetical protein